LLIPQRRYKIPPFVPGIRLFIQLPDIRKPIQRLFLKPRLPGHAPSFTFVDQRGVEDDELDHVLQALEAAHDVGAVRPGTADVDVECIAVFFGGKWGIGGGGDGGAEGGGFTFEGAVFFGEGVGFGLGWVSWGVYSECIVLVRMIKSHSVTICIVGCTYISRHFVTSSLQ
jgi:hypothetical protein